MSQKQRIREQIVREKRFLSANSILNFGQSERQDKIRQTEGLLEKAEDVSSRLLSVHDEIERDTQHLKKREESITLGNFEARIDEIAGQNRLIEVQRDKLSDELKSLTTDTNTRATLDIRRAEIKAKTIEIGNM